MGVGELRHGALGRHLAIGCDDKAAPRDRQAALGSKKLQAVWLGLAARRLAVRPCRRPAGIFEESVLGIGRFAVVAQAESAAQAANGLRSRDSEAPVND